MDDHQTFIDQPTRLNLPDLEDALVRTVLDAGGAAGGAGPQKLASLYHQCAEYANRGPEREVLLLRVAELLLDAGAPSGALEILQLLAGDAGRVMRRQRVRIMRRLEPELSREQDRVCLLTMLLPLLEGEQVRAGAEELIDLGQSLDAPGAVVDGCLHALAANAMSAGTLERVGGHLAERGHAEELERLVEQGARRVIAGAARGRIPLLVALAGLTEQGLGDPARAAKLWWETWRREGATAGDGGLATASLERIYEELSDWDDYCRVLHREAMLAGDVSATVGVLRRLATVQARAMEDEDAAGATLGRILQLIPGDQQTLAALQELDGGRRRDVPHGAGNGRERPARERLRQEWAAGRIPRALWSLGRMDPGRAENRQLVHELLEEAQEHDDADRLEQALRRGSLVLLGFLCCGTSTGELELEHLRTVKGLARRMEQAGMRHEAAAYYRRVLTVTPDDEQVRRQLEELRGGERYRDPTVEELASAAKAMVKHSPRRAAQTLIQAAQLATSQQGPDGEAAGDYLARATELGLSLPPGELGTLTALEEALREAKLYPELARVLEAAAAAEDDAVRRKHILCELERVHLEAGHHPERAVEALQQALMLDPEDEALSWRLRDLHRTLKDHRSRARNLESLLAHTSGEERAPLTEELGAIYSRDLGEDQAAAMHYEELLSHMPDHERALRYCRAAYERAGDYVSVIRILGEAAGVSEERHARAALHADAARVAMQRLTDLDLAIHHWQEAIRARPEDRAQYEGLHQVLEAGGRWEELREALLSGVARTLELDQKLPLYKDLCRVARKLGDDEGAAGYLINALQLSPGDGELLGQLEATYERMGQWRMLAVTLRRHADHEQDKPAQLKLLLRAARVLLIRLGRDDEALAICERIIEAHPGDRVAATLMGEILGKRGQWEEKITLLRGQIEREDDPKELGRLHLELGRVLLDRVDDVETASVHFEVALNLAGRGQGDVLALLRRVYDARERLDLLVELLRRRSSMDSISPAEQAAALCEMARIQDEHMGEHEQATEVFERALELDPRCLTALSALREQAAGRKQWWEALELAHRELKLEEDPGRRAALLVELGTIQFEHLDEYQQAKESLSKALKLVPDDTRALSLLGRIHFECQDWEETREVTGRLVDQVRDQDDLHEHLYRLAFALEKLDREEEAFRLYIRSFTREPMYVPTLDRMVDLCFTHRQWDNTLRIAETILQSYASSKSVERQAELHLRIGLCELYLGQREAGTEFLQQLVLESGDVPVAGPKAWTEVTEPWASNALEPLLLHCMRDGVRDRVAEATRQCLKLVPDHSEALQVFAAIRLSQQQWDEGLHAIERAARSERTTPERGAALLTCAGEVARRRLGSRDRARAYYQWAQSLDPSAEAIRSRLQRLDAGSEDRPILLTRPKRRTAPRPPTEAAEEPPIRKQDTQPFRSGLFKPVETDEE